MNPELSVAMIFKNEIRCIERCLKSLQPLKEHISCEIVMADTGSTDGSRAVAEQYADKVFDFLWINDFSAARNAVLGRCSGEWVLTVDCDEWLAEEYGELADFLRSGSSHQFDLAQVIQRNYTSADFRLYQDFPAARLLRMSAKPYYEGIIHESPVFSVGNRQRTVLSKTVLHHDGYVNLNGASKEGREKRKRNTTLLCAELAKTPDDLRCLLRYLESAADEEDYLSTLRHAVALVIKKQGDWRHYGAAILRHAVFDANRKNLAELDDWIQKAGALFPNSYYTRIDISAVLLARAYEASVGLS